MKRIGAALRVSLLAAIFGGVGLMVPPLASAADCFCGSPPHADVYEGLLPEGVHPTPVATELVPTALADMKVVVVASANFNEYSRRWIAWWEPGGRADQHMVGLQSLTGLNRQDLNGAEHGTDPRQFADQVIQILQSSFREVAVADDLAAAHEMNADIYVIIDAWLGAGFGGQTFRSWHGVYVLDGSLNQIAALSKDASAVRLPIPLPGAVVRADNNSRRVAVQRSSEPVLADLRHLLGQPPAAVQ